MKKPTTNYGYIPGQISAVLVPFKRPKVTKLESVSRKVLERIYHQLAASENGREISELYRSAHSRLIVFGTTQITIAPPALLWAETG